MGPLRGVDGHFDFVPPPTTGTASFCAGSRISIGLSVTTARSLADGLRVAKNFHVPTMCRTASAICKSRYPKL